MERVYQQNWIELPKDIREHLQKVFGIIRTGISEVRDNTLISDGITNEDLGVITSVKMAEYVGSMDTFSRLWDISISKAKYELNPPIEINLDNMKEVSNEEFDTIQKLNNIATPEQIQEFTDMIKPVSTPIVNDLGVSIDVFCNDCTSKGVSHKKECIHYVPTRPELNK